VSDRPDPSFIRWPHRRNKSLDSSRVTGNSELAGQLVRARPVTHEPIDLLLAIGQFCYWSLIDHDSGPHKPASQR
jgi:hypothetical protein